MINPRSHLRLQPARCRVSFLLSCTPKRYSKTGSRGHSRLDMPRLSDPSIQDHICAYCEKIDVRVELKDPEVNITCVSTGNEHLEPRLLPTSCTPSTNVVLS